MYNAKIIFPDGSYNNPDVISKTIDYIYHNKNFPGGCYGIFPPTPQKAKAEFQGVRIYNRTFSHRQVWHFFISFSNSLDKSFLLKYADELAYAFGIRYQICYALHTDTNHLHIHFVVSSHSYIIGEPNLDKDIMEDFVSIMKSVSLEYNIELKEAKNKCLKTMTIY